MVKGIEKLRAELQVEVFRDLGDVIVLKPREIDVDDPRTRNRIASQVAANVGADVYNAGVKARTGLGAKRRTRGRIAKCGVQSGRGRRKLKTILVQIVKVVTVIGVDELLRGAK